MDRLSWWLTLPSLPSDGYEGTPKDGEPNPCPHIADDGTILLPSLQWHQFRKAFVIADCLWSPSTWCCVYKRCKCPLFNLDDSVVVPCACLLSFVEVLYLNAVQLVIVNYFIKWIYLSFILYRCNQMESLIKFNSHEEKHSLPLSYQFC